MKRFVLSVALISALYSMEINNTVNEPVEINTTQNVTITSQGNVAYTDSNESNIYMILYKAPFLKNNYIINNGNIILNSEQYTPDVASGIIVFQEETNQDSNISGSIINNGLIRVDTPVNDQIAAIALYNNSEKLINNGEITVKTEQADLIAGSVCMYNSGNLENNGTINVIGDNDLIPGDADNTNVFGASKINTGAIFIKIDNNGTISNLGTINSTSKGISVNGVNHAAILNSGTINLRKFEKDSILPLVGIFANLNDKTGIIKNTGTISIVDTNLSDVVNIGSVENNGTIENDGTLSNMDMNTSDSQTNILVGNNNGTIINKGYMSNSAYDISENQSNILVRQNTGTIVNKGTMSSEVNAKEIDSDFLGANNSIAVEENNGTIENDGNISASGISIYAGNNNGEIVNNGTIKNTYYTNERAGGIIVEDGTSGKIVNNGKIIFNSNINDNQNYYGFVIGGENTGSITNNGLISVNSKNLALGVGFGNFENQKTGTIENNGDINFDISFSQRVWEIDAIFAKMNQNLISNKGNVNIDINMDKNITSLDPIPVSGIKVLGENNGTIQNGGNINLSFTNTKYLGYAALTGINTRSTRENSKIINNGNITETINDLSDKRKSSAIGIYIGKDEDATDNNGIIQNNGSITINTNLSNMESSGINVNNNIGSIENDGTITMNIKQTVDNLELDNDDIIYAGIDIQNDNNGSVANNGTINMNYQQKSNLSGGVIGILIEGDNNGEVKNTGKINISAYNYSSDKFNRKNIQEVGVVGIALANANNNFVNEGNINISTNYIGYVTGLDIWNDRGESLIFKNSADITINEFEKTDQTIRNAQTNGIHIVSNNGTFVNSGNITLNTDLNSTQVDSAGIYIESNQGSFKNTGNISGFANGLHFDETSSVIENEGNISATQNGIYIEDVADSIVNKGNINAKVGINVQSGSIENDGLITGDTAILYNSSRKTESVYITNNGTVDATTAVDYNNSNNAVFLNNGIVKGSIADRTGRLNVINNGSVYIQNDTNDTVNNYQQTNGTLKVSIDSQKSFKGFIKAETLQFANNNVKIGFSSQKNIVQWYENLESISKNEKFLGNVIYYSDISGLSEQNITGTSYFDFSLENNQTAKTYYITVKKAPDAVSRTIPHDNRIAGNMLSALDKMFNSSSISAEETVLFNNLALQNSDDKVKTLLSLTPQTATTGAYVGGGVMNSIGSVISSRQNGINAGDETLERNIWFKPFYKHISQSDKDGINGYSANVRGIGIGVDKQYDIDGNYLGMAFFYANGSSSVNNTDDSSKIKNYSLSIYGGQPVFNFKSSLSYYLTFALQHNDTKRYIYSTPYIAKGKFTAKAVNADITLSSRLNASEKFEIIPLAGIDYRYYHQPSYTESGAGALDLKVKSYDKNDLIVKVGANSKYSVNDKNKLFFGMFASYNCINKKPTITSALVGADNIDFQTDGLARKRMMYKLSAGYKNILNVRSFISIDYFYKTNFNGLKENAASFKFNYKF